VNFDEIREKGVIATAAILSACAQAWKLIDRNGRRMQD
jgi:hypothetical protein